MKLTAQAKKGFTLIELVVVVAILGVLAAVLITVINPLDKINAANDAGVSGTMIQLGKAMDSYASNNTNLYPAATTFAGVVTALNTAGEIKQTAISSPNANYTYNFAAPASCAVATPQNCTSYIFWTNLYSSKNTTGNASGNLSYFVAANGKTCVLKNQASAPTIATTCP